MEGQGLSCQLLQTNPKPCLKIVPETFNPKPINPKPLHIEPPTRTPYPLATPAYPGASLELWVLVFELRGEGLGRRA